MAGFRAKAKYQVTAEDKTRGALRSIKGNVRGIESTLKGLAIVGAAALGARGLAGSFRALVSSVASSFDDIAKSSRRLGIAVEELDALNFVAELNGASAKDLETIYKRGARSIVDASRGLESAARPFRELGIEATDSAGRVKTISEILLEVADALPRLKSETQKTALVLEIFGRSGQQLIPMLRGGSEAIREQMAEAFAYGLRTQENTRLGEDYVDAQLRLNRAFRSTKDTIATAALPALTELADTLANKLLAATTGVDREFRLFLGTLRTFDDESFGLAAADEAEALADQISRATEKVEALGAALQEQAKLEARDTRTEGFSRQYFQAFDALKKAREELDDLLARERLLGDVVDERNRKNEASLATQKRNRDALLADLRRDSDELAAAEPFDFVSAPFVEAKKALLEIKAEMLSVPEFRPIRDEEFERLRDFLEELDFQLDSFAADFGSTFGSAIDSFVQRGRTGADVFEQAWRSALGRLAGSLAAYGIAQGIGALIPGAQTFLQAAGFLQGQATAAAPKAPSPPGVTVNYQPRALVPSGVADFVRARSRIADTIREANALAFSRT